MKTVNIIHECQQLELVGCFRYSIVWKHGKCTGRTFASSHETILLWWHLL